MMSQTLLKTIELDECDSTNDEAWRFEPRTLILANRQRSGRGRQGRTWESDASGNIYASLHLEPPGLMAPWIPLAAGVSAIEALQHACEALNCPTPRNLRLKWPNDIMIAHAKMGGILCESRVMGEKLSGIVVGFGLNFSHAPKISSLETVDLFGTIDLKPQSQLSPSLRSAVRTLIARQWALRLIEWNKLLAKERTSELREAWKTWAKLETFSELEVHDRNGKKVSLQALDLDVSGKLKAVRAGENPQHPEIVFLDQADSI
ncbi:MAG: biotin--[acetyl-CoA-carboxylase] ligase [Bdellovibrionota bacterium]